MRIRSVVTLLGLSFTALVGIAGESKESKFKILEKSPSLSFKVISRAYQQAKSISFKYVPLEESEPVYLSKDFVSKHWKYSFVRNCPHRCDGAMNELRRRLESGLQIDKACDAPFTVAIEFRGEEGNVLSHIVVDSTGRCYVLGEESFFIPEERNSIASLASRLKNGFEGG